MAGMGGIPSKEPLVFLGVIASKTSLSLGANGKSEWRAYNRDNGVYSVTSQEKEQMTKLCKQIEVEQDQNKFIQLVKELNDLLDGKTERLEHKPSSPLNIKI